MLHNIDHYFYPLPLQPLPECYLTRIGILFVLVVQKR